MSGSGRFEARLEIANEELVVTRFRLERRLSRPDQLVCDVLRPDASIMDAAAQVGLPASFKLLRVSALGSEGEALHGFYGDVVRGRHKALRDGAEVVELAVVPWLWRAARRRDSRTYQEMSVEQIVTAALGRSGIPAERLRWLASAANEQRAYVVQHAETDLEFCERVLAEAGVGYTCEHSLASEQATLVFFDSAVALGRVQPDNALRFRSELGDDGADDIVAHLQRTVRVRPGATRLRDYNPARPKLELAAEAESALDPGLSVYAYPARRHEPPQVEERATRLLDALNADRVVISGQTSALHLAPAHQVELEQHPRADLCGVFFITGLSLSGEEGRQFTAAGAGGLDPADVRYRCMFEAIPVEQLFRPLRPGALQLPGLQTAVTTGASGEAIHTNEEGAVSIQYPWDRVGTRDERSSRWVRTSQLATGGAMLLPRVGWEVSVAHTEGDADNPVVMGRLYNGETPPPYALPENAARSALQTATTPGDGSSNELRMSDVKGDEQMFFNASRDMTISVGNNVTQSIGNDWSVKVGVNQSFSATDSLTSTIGANQSTSVGANQELSVGTLMVDDIGSSHALSVGGNRMHMIGGDHRHTVEADSTFEVGSAAVHVVIGDVSDTTDSAMTHDVSAAFVEIAAGDRSLSVTGARTETTGAAKVIVASAGVGLQAGALSTTTGGARVVKVDGDVNDQGNDVNELVLGTHKAQAKNVTIEAESKLSLVLGAATIVIAPSKITVSGASIEVDAASVDLGVIMNN